MTHIRLHGDPFGDGAASCALRSFLRTAQEHGLRVSLSLAGVPAGAPGEGERPVEVDDGPRRWAAVTRLPERALAPLLAAARVDVAASAPVVTFAKAGERDDSARLAGLAWPEASAVIAARGDLTSEELLARLKAELRWAGTEDPVFGLPERRLRPWLALEHSTPSCVLHVAHDLFACGSDLVVETFAAHFAEAGLRLRLVLPSVSEKAVAELLAVAGQAADKIDVVRRPFAAAQVRDAAVLVQPYRRFEEPASLVLALASGRPVVAARFAATAPLLAGESVSYPVGGRYVREGAAGCSHFSPDRGALRAAWASALGERMPSSVGERARSHVVARFMGDRPAPPSPPVPSLRPSRPVVALEAPLFERSATAELTLATAQALVSRGNVDVRLIPRAPFRRNLAWLRERAPELEGALSRHPGSVDLWLSAGWPVRADRPDCRRWAQRLDSEDGALPIALTPHVTEESDGVVVHSGRVRRMVTSAGRREESVHLIPHGVDAAMRPTARPDERVLAFKRDLPAVLFCGGLCWREGVDVFLNAVLAAKSAGFEFVVVVKEMGAEQNFGAGHLGELLDRFEATAGTPPLLRLREDPSRAALASLFTSCDVLMNPHRGGSSCMSVLAARACGLPVVATADGATELASAGAGVRGIRAAHRPLELSGAHVSQPWVLEPDTAAAAKQLQGALSNLPQERASARALSTSVRDMFSWDAAAAAIEALASDAAAPASVEPTVALPTSPPPDEQRRSSTPLLRPSPRPQVALRS